MDNLTGVRDSYGSRETRATFLLDGRRVTLSDLIDAQLLEVGEKLRFSRPRKGKVHYAHVTPSGGVRLEDGREFRSSSRAAATAAEIRAVDGWHAWVVDSSDVSLDSLRARLLDSVAAEVRDNSADLDETESDIQQRHTLLKNAREKADADQPAAMTVRDLIALWGARSRGHRLDQRIEADLANHGLTTSPSFRKVTLDTSVLLFALAVNDPDTPNESEPAETEPEDLDDGDVGLTVGNLPSALGGVVSVTPNSTIEEAITTMLVNDFSQLAVMSGTHTLRGAITWKSIAQIRNANPNADFSDAIIEATAVRYDKDLIDVLSILEESDFVFVTDEKRAIAGIVTNADVVHAYGELATPFFLIGELDQALRHVIAKTFSLSEVSSCCDADGARDIRSFDELTIGDYQRVLERPDNWGKIGWALDRSVIIKRLDELREIRNDVMHFNPDPVPLDTVNKLRNFTQLLRSYSDR